MLPLIPMLTRVGAMMLAKKYAKKKLKKKILKDPKLKKKVDKIGKKALKKEAKKKDPERKRKKPRQNNEERRRDFTKRKKIDKVIDRAMEYILPKSLKKVKTHEFDKIMEREKNRHEFYKDAKRNRN